MSVLFTYCQVTKSNWINLIDFGKNVKVLTTTKSLLWYQYTAVFLTYYHGMYLKLLNLSRLHCYSRRSQWNRGLTTIIWSLESLSRRKEQTKWGETVYTMLRSRCRQHLLAKKNLIEINYQQSQNLEPVWHSFTITLQIRFLMMHATLCNIYFVPLEFPVHSSQKCKLS